ncbi:SDR family NAD(P)-dependent oxidoreductase [Lentzea sp. DG1S-22]|uniref:SDR family NAD(P)-dependent oxidoreductase n=1 Tax=Lentzea sp. DG1S-22 TaxID=3108822 RepID=UPI002E7A0C43|nr:SDR family NAD(P)-dependent oxidoreductase [Lentzea sp. DG1S-22]WVH83420.1 SDR family NAD(P)-dependent oxidoreductase [Lentzea sp. DG1S-22]
MITPDHAAAAAQDGIAVIGLSCRLPRAENPDAFWRLLVAGASAVTETPATRWDANALYDADLSRPGRANSRWGGYLDEVDRFDAAFFGISPREAADMDPQQRLALELAWEALENAGVVPAALREHAVGVFMGAFGSDYATLAQREGIEEIGHHTVTGLSRALIANRISYTLGLRGPSFTVDSAQSSALVAVHLAAQSIRTGECEVALAGGVHLNLAPESTAGAAKFGGLSPDGRCHTFDARANGYVRGEGGGVVVLKPLAKALADQDDILCVIRGSAVNNDGASDGLTTPDATAQAEVLRAAYRAADVDPRQVRYVELHGTGTRVGDPVEASALGRVLGAGRAPADALRVGSVKTNIGHLEGAAGIAGLLKTVLSISRGQLPPSLNFTEPNPDIAFDELGIRVQTETEDWSAEPRLAGVSSFGVGGANCHVVLSGPPRSGKDGETSSDHTEATLPFVLSAKTPEALRAQARNLRGRDLDRAGLAQALLTRRTLFDHRAVVLAATADELDAGLAGIEQGVPGAGVVLGRSEKSDAGPVFVFPGQAQWAGMSRDLLDVSEVFADSVAACEKALAPHVDWSLTEVLRTGDGLNRVDVVQPASWAVMVSLARLWASAGVRPAAVLGHSQGEIAAAVVSGKLDLDDAATVVALRSKIIAAELAGHGAMASVDMPADEVRSRLAGHPGVEVAVVNSARSTVVSGDQDAVEALVAQWKQEGLRARRIAVDYASHSPHVDSVREQVVEALAGIRPRQGSTPFFSTADCAWTDRLDAAYRAHNLRAPVRFGEATEALLAEGFRHFVEVSSHPVLVGAVGDTVTAADVDDAVVVGSLRRDEGDFRRFLTSAAEAFTGGMDVDWSTAVPSTRTRVRAADLPTYPFQRQRFWIGDEEEAPVDTGPVLHGIDLGDADLQRMAGVGIAPLSTADAVAAFGGALRSTEPVLAPVRLDLRSVTGQPVPLPADLVRTPVVTEPAAAEPEPSADFGELTGDELRAELTRLVLTSAAAALGHARLRDDQVGQPFSALGMDSLTALELRNRLREATGLRLSPTLLFDRPSPLDVIDHVVEELSIEKDTTVTHVIQPTEPDPEPEEAGDDPVVIVGMAARFPGGVSSPQELWDLVATGTDAITAFPDNRGWDLDTLFHDDPAHRGTSYAREGGFLHDAADFDASFFGIAPREALATDPQQRLLLETSWEALENAGIDPLSLKGSRTGVYAGVMFHDYSTRVGDVRDIPDGMEGMLTVGSHGSVASGRISYVFGLQGPTMSVDTACSSSLVALHLATQALRTGECSMALVGGVAVMSTPVTFVEFSRQRALAADGRCRSFSADASGTSWAEGAGMLVVERLSDARRNGHRVLAVVRGSAVNSDGASNGLTAPSGSAQRRLIEQALADARLTASDVDVVEAHGTGTPLGDPIEAQAVLRTYGQNRDRPLWLGSLKSNTGHTQAAAGVGGIIKMIMAMRHGVLPKTLHVSKPSPHADWTAGSVELLTEARPWPEGTRRAAVSSFGISGTNAHVILESPAEAAVPATEPRAGAITPWVLSARTPAALRAQAAKLADFLDREPGHDDRAVAAALMRRSRFDQRAVVLGGDRDSLLAGLTAAAHGDDAPNLVVAAEKQAGRTAFLFAGQGSQRAGMGRELYEAYPPFAAAFDEAAEVLDPLLGVSLRDLVFTGDSLDRTEHAQPALFALEVSLFRLLEAWGVRPDRVAGHSIGEIAAAHVAGVMSLRDAATLVAARGRLMGELPEGGVMVAVEAAAAEVTDLLAGREHEVGIAAVNGPGATVLSGAAAGVQAITEQLRSRGHRTKALRVSHAFHSPLMGPMLEQFRDVVSRIEFSAPSIPMVSTLTGQDAGAGDFTTAEYWVRHVRESVRFEDAVRVLEAGGVKTFVELGPDSVLSASASASLSPSAVSLPLLRKDRVETRALLDTVAKLFVRGTSVDWSAVLGEVTLPHVELPTYAFQRQRFWLDTPRATRGVTGTGLDAVGHPLLTASMSLAGSDTTVLIGQLSTARPAWAGGHRVGGAAVVPGTALLEMAAKAGGQVGCPRVAELLFRSAVVLPAEGTLDVQVEVSAPQGDGSRALTLHSRTSADAPWTAHATGRLIPGMPGSGENLTEWPPANAEPVGLDGLYSRLAEDGLDYGPDFQGVRRAWRRGDDVFAEVTLPAAVRDEAGDYLVHPALLDSALHPLAADVLRLPFSWAGVEVHGPGASSLRVRLRSEGQDSFGITAWDNVGMPVLSADELVARPVVREQLQVIGAAQAQETLFRIDWKAPEKLSGPRGTGHLTLTVDNGDPAMPLPRRVRTALDAALASVRGWLERDHEPGARLAVLTRGAVDGDPVAAAVWGLVRSAQTEHPGRLQLIDLDGSAASDKAWRDLVGTDEPQLAVRGGQVRVPRLAGAGPAGPSTPEWRGGSLLVTGAGGVVGSALTRHAVREHGVRDVVLLSRRGADAPGMARLSAELRELGASVTVEACDAADREQLAGVLARIPSDRPLAGVIHAAGTSRDATIQSLTAEALEAVLPAKVDAVTHLDELTRDAGLTWFVVCSSAAAWWGTAGQANYAAANACIDAIARRRHNAGQHALSLAWGLWAERSELSGHLDEADLRRLARLGLKALSTEDALATFDVALRSKEPMLAPIGLDTRQLVDSESAPLTPLLREHVKSRPAVESAPVPSIRGELAGKDEGAQEAFLRDLVCKLVSQVLGFASAGEVEPDRGFFEIGFDSLTVLELRNRVEKATGQSVPPTAIFDHSTPGALAKYLRIHLGGAQEAERSHEVGRPSLAGTTVLLTGATGGLGRLFARELAEAGANLVLTGRDQAALDELADSIGAPSLALVADVTDGTALTRAVERAEQEFGSVDVLINNAGVSGPAGPLWEVDEDHWWQAMEVNVRGTMRACRAALPGMVERGRGRVINIVSSAGKHRWPNVSGYSVSKAAAIKLGENLALELAGTGVSVLNYHPGLVDLGLTRRQLEAGKTGDRHIDGVGAWMADQRDSGRFTTPEDSSEMLVRLVAGEADALSGSYLTPEDELGRLLGG